MKSILSILFFLIFISSCGNTQKTDIEILKHETLELDNLIMSSPGAIRYLNSHLVILDYDSDSLFHLIDPIKKIYNGNYGSKGMGPKEFIHPVDLNLYMDKSLCCYDLIRHILTKIDVDTSKVAKLNFYPIIRIDSCSNLNLIPTKDNLFIGVGAYIDNKFKIINDKGEIIKNLFHHPYRDNDEGKISEAIRAMAYQGPMDIYDNKIVHTTFFAKIISFYEIKKRIKLELIREIKDSYPSYRPEKNGSSTAAGMDSKSPTGFIDVIALKNSVYALYSGRSFREYQLSSQESEHLYKYNWKGELIKQYKLDIPVLCFCVDEPNNIIYGVANNPDPVIVKFTLKD